MSMLNYVIVTDSCSDLPKALAEEYGIHVLQLEVRYENGEIKSNDEIDYADYFARLRAKEKITTSAVNMETFSACFEKILKEGKDILYLAFSSALSATYKAATLAAEDLAEKYPDRKILVVDTKCAALGEGLLAVLVAEKCNKEGLDIDAAYAYALETVPKLCHQFTVDDLFFLKRGGRVSAATAVVGTMLAIKPIMHVDDEGRLIKVSTTRGRKNSIAELFNRMKATFLENESQKVFIGHSDCYDDAVLLRDMIKEAYPSCEVLIDYVGAVISAHSGPGTLALFHLGTER